MRYLQRVNKSMAIFHGLQLEKQASRSGGTPFAKEKPVPNACLWEFQFFMHRNRFHFLLAKGRRHLDRAGRKGCDTRDPGPGLILQQRDALCHECEHLWRLKGLSNTSSVLRDKDKRTARVWGGCRTSCCSCSTQKRGLQHLVFFRLLKLPFCRLMISLGGLENTSRDLNCIRRQPTRNPNLPIFKWDSLPFIFICKSISSAPARKCSHDMQNPQKIKPP